MKVISGWGWRYIHVPTDVKIKEHSSVKVFDLELLPETRVDFSEYCEHETVLISGDGHSLPEDVKNFESFDVPHDIFCVNRSMLFFERPINHWGAVDAEEGVWFSENVNRKIMRPGSRPILRHGIGHFPIGYDVYWRAINFHEMDDTQKHIWTGNTGFFAILACYKMGYKKIVLAGIPLDTKQHWYEPEGTAGPEWLGKVYRQWIDFKMLMTEAEQVRSMSGYSGFIFGEPSKEWLNGNSI